MQSQLLIFFAVNTRCVIVKDMAHRLEKLNELIPAELGEILLREVELPAGTLVTITKAEVTGDLKLAKIWVSVLPEGSAKEVLGYLNKRAPNLRALLAKKIKIKFMPQIKFYYDKTEVEAEVVERLLDEIKKD